MSDEPCPATGEPDRRTAGDEETPPPLAWRPASRGGSHVGLPVTGIALAAVAIGAVSAWLFSRYREEPLGARTRDRLQPRAPRHEAPSAADIRVD